LVGTATAVGVALAETGPDGAVALAGLADDDTEVGAGETEGVDDWPAQARPTSRMINRSVAMAKYLIFPTLL